LWGLFAAWVVFVVHGLVDSPYWKNDLSLEFWTLAAIEIVVIAAIQRSAKPPPSPEILPLRPAPP
jgi:hypothetical protein